MTSFHWRFLSVGLLVASLAAASHAAEKPEAVTDAALADGDFKMQGEYQGWAWNPQVGYEWTGLQVVAKGNGRFSAMLYRGGLPGLGWDRQTRWKLASDDAAPMTLTGDDHRLVLGAGMATLQDSAGRSLGQLQRTERRSPLLGAPPPAGATVLFNGGPTDELKDAKITDDGLLQVGTETVQPYRDFRMHLEFRTPYEPAASGQGRGNSGVYIQGRYEVQILDSFGLEGEKNECGSLYKTIAPAENMAFPPLSWQTYDIDFFAARFDAAGKKIQNARITVWHNGVLIHNQSEIPNKTGAGAEEADTPRPIKLQDHSNPVHFRNIWIVEYTAPATNIACQPACCRPVKKGLFRRWR